ncbi:hypothetical protein UY3_07978 [Chelonia mydas]|uniref:Uncharacterized protein n=1 Tax=Chelonia mydas TaxID=8469 RepID=M7BCP6_CHEMY|nr:hypothetical protein UY3_07978 [Chelonia mydas]
MSNTGPSSETQMVEDEAETTSEELPPHLREEPPEGISASSNIRASGVSAGSFKTLQLILAEGARIQCVGHSLCPGNQTAVPSKGKLQSGLATLITAVWHLANYTKRARIAASNTISSGSTCMNANDPGSDNFSTNKTVTDDSVDPTGANESGTDDTFHLTLITVIRSTNPMSTIYTANLFGSQRLASFIPLRCSSALLPSECTPVGNLT